MKFCSESISDGYGVRRCAKQSKVEVGGKPYCGIHDPIRVAKKRAERDAKWDAEWKASSAESKRRVAIEEACKGLTAEEVERAIIAWKANP